MIGKRKEEILPVKAYNPWTRPWNTVSGGDGQGEGPTCFRGPSISDSMVLHGAETSGKEKPIITEAQKMYRGLGILESTPRFNPAAASANARLDRGRSGPTREDEFSGHCAPFQTEFFGLFDAADQGISFGVSEYRPRVFQAVSDLPWSIVAPFVFQRTATGIGQSCPVLSRHWIQWSIIKWPREME